VTVPKKVDHHARRTQIADALMRIAAAQGLEAVSLRHVAAEAGVSAGMVQHYFRTKDEMMTFALGVVSDRVQSRIAAEVAGGTPSPKGIVRAVLTQMLPLTEPRLLEGQVALAFFAYAAHKPEFASGLHETTAGMQAFIADQIRAATAAPTHLDPDHAAMVLLAVVEGLGLYIVSHHYPPDAALAVFDTHLDAVFGPSN